MSQISDRIFERLGPDKEIALEFFAVFSRFECALKCSEYVKGNNQRAEPDWDEYAKHLEKDSELKKEINEAAKYILDKPPQKQIIKSRMVQWDKAHNSESGILLIFKLIGRVRNNLFHGGKYKGQYTINNKRDEELVKTCLTILYICLKDKESSVTKAFESELDLTDRDLAD